MHGEQITAESVESQGTTFMMTLPRAAAKQSTLAELSSR